MFARIINWVRRLFRRECHYINGPETLPPPLTREEEETVMNELRAGDNTHRELLVVPRSLTVAKPPRRIW